MGGNSSKEARRGPVLNPVNPDDCPVLSSRDGSSGASASGADSNCPIPERYRGGDGVGVYNVYNQRLDGGCGPWTLWAGRPSAAAPFGSLRRLLAQNGSLLRPEACRALAPQTTLRSRTCWKILSGWRAGEGCALGAPAMPGCTCRATDDKIGF